MAHKIIRMEPKKLDKIIAPTNLDETTELNCGGPSVWNKINLPEEIENFRNTNSHLTLLKQIRMLLIIIAVLLTIRIFKR